MRQNFIKISFHPIIIQFLDNRKSNTLGFRLLLAPQIFRPSLRPCGDSAGDEPVNMSCVKRIIY